MTSETESGDPYAMFSALALRVMRLEAENARLRSLFEPFEHHACLTGDCSHGDSNTCIETVKEWLAESHRTLIPNEGEKGGEG